jgi:hypothetical protein
MSLVEGSYTLTKKRTYVLKLFQCFQIFSAANARKAFLRSGDVLLGLSQVFRTVSGARACLVAEISEIGRLIIIYFGKIEQTLGFSLTLSFLTLNY